MRNRLLLAVAAVLLLGTLIDGTVHRESVSLRICCTFEEPAPLGERVVPTLVTHATSADGLWVQLRRHAPGVTLLVAENGPDWDSPRLRTIAAVADVRTIEFGAFDLPGDPVAIDRRDGRWTIRVASGPVGAMVVADRSGASHFVDVRLLDDPTLSVDVAPVPESEVTFARSADDPPSMSRAILADSTILLAFLLIGGLLLPRGVVSRSLRLILAPLVGLSLHATIGLLLLPGALGLGATAVTAALVAIGLRATGADIGWRASDLPGVVGLGAVIVTTVAVARLHTFLFVHPGDGAEYWAGGAALADGTLRPEFLDVKRGLAQQALHAPGFVLGGEGLQGLGAVLLVLGVLVLVAHGRRTVGTEIRGGNLLVLVLALAFAVSLQMWVFAEFLNSHLLVAVLLAALVILLDRGLSASWSLVPATASIIGALVLSRPEGALLVGLALLGTLAATGKTDERSTTDPRSLQPAWVALGLTTLLWAARLSSGSLSEGRAVPLAVVLTYFIGIAALLFSLIITRAPGGLLRRTPLVGGVALWGATLLLLRSDEVVFLDSVLGNLGRGFGGWGTTGPMLMLVGLLAVLLTMRKHLEEGLWVLAARWVLIGFIPVQFFARLGGGLEREDGGLEVLLSGGGRLGPIDSVNRMWAHAVLIVLLLLIAGVRRGSDEELQKPVEQGRLVIVPGALLFILAGGWVASQWQPAYLPMRGPSDSIRVHTVLGEEPIAQLVEGISVSQGIAIPRPALPAGARPERVCVGVGLATLDRQTFGTYQLELQAGDVGTSRTIDGRRVEDWSVEQVCLDVAPKGTSDDAGDRLDEMLSRMQVTVRGGGTSTGPAAVVLQGPGSAVGAVITQTDTDGRESQRRVNPLVMTVDVHSELPTPPLWGIADGAVSLLPWLMVVLGAGALLAPVRGQASR